MNVKLKPSFNILNIDISMQRNIKDTNVFHKYLGSVNINQMNQNQNENQI